MAPFQPTEFKAKFLTFCKNRIDLKYFCSMNKGKKLDCCILCKLKFFFDKQFLNNFFMGLQDGIGLGSTSKAKCIGPVGLYNSAIVNC